MATGSSFTLRSRARLLLGFAAMPPLAAALMYLAFPVLWYIGGHEGQPTDPEQVARTFGVMAGVLSLLVTLCAAVPAVDWLTRRGPVSLPQAAVAGLILGNVPFALYVAAVVLPATVVHILRGTMSQHLSPIGELAAGTLRVLVIGSVLGVSCATAFWFLALFRSDAEPHRGAGV